MYVKVVVLAVSVGIFFSSSTFAQQGKAIGAYEQPPIEFKSATLGDRSLRYGCVGNGSPTVIIEQALGNSIEVEFTRPVKAGWAVVVPKVAELTRVCVYDRAGLGKSSPQTSPRTSMDSAREVRAMLEKERLTPPFVVVGNSIGGLNARAFSNEYRSDVVGMVLVDSSSFDMNARFSRLLPPSDPNEPAMIRSIRNGPDRPMQGGEWYDFKAIADLGATFKDLDSMPLIVLSRNPDTPPPPGAPAEGARMMEALWSEIQTDLSKLSSNSKHIVAKKAGHFIQVDEPDLVVDAILDVVKKARARR